MPRVTLSQDEWILCLEFYLRHRKTKLPGQNSAEAKELSNVMRRIREALSGKPEENFRPPYGVLRRVYEFKYLDSRPDKISGIPKRAKDVWETWGEQSHASVEKLARAIKKCIPAEEVLAIGEEAITYNRTASEGQILTRVHSVRERNKAIVRLKKEWFQDHNRGRLFCEVCEFDFARTYPKHGEGFIECHHLKPLSQLRPNQETTLDDLALLCSNCHRMVHYRSPWLNMNELGKVLSHGGNKRVNLS